MRIFRIPWCVLFLGLIAQGCGPVTDLLGKNKSSKGSGRPFHIVRLATTAEVSSQSIQPLKAWYGATADITTDALVASKLVFRVDTDMSPDELRERRPRGIMTYGGVHRTADVQVNESGSHELQFLNLNVRHGGLEGPLVPPQSIEDLKDLGPESKILMVDLFLSGVPHKKEGTQVQLVLIQVDTMPQTQGGKIRLSAEENKPIKWHLPGSPGFAVRWKFPDK